MSSTIAGFAVPYNVPGICADGTHETVAPGSLDFSGDVDLRIGHEGRPLARTGNGSLRLWSTEFGIAFQADLATTTAASFSGCSIGLTIDDACEELVDGCRHRRVMRGTIHHIAVLGSSDDGPAYPGTGAWPIATLSYELPPQLRDLAAVWRRGRPAETEKAPMSHLHPNRRPRAMPVAVPTPPPAGRILAPTAPAAAPTVVPLNPRAQQPAPEPLKPHRRSWFASARRVMAALVERVERLEARAAVMDERGRDGRDGRDGRGVLAAEIDGAGCLVLRYSDGSESRVGLVVGPPGPRSRVLLPGE